MDSTKYYVIKDNGFHEKVLTVLNEYGASIVYHQREQTVAEYDKDGNQLYGGWYDLSQGYYISAPGAVYIIVRVAMNAGEIGYIATGQIQLKSTGINEIVLDQNTSIHVEFNENSKELGKRYTICDDGFHEMAMSVLEEYGASTVYYNVVKYIQELDKDGNLLNRFKMDLKFVDNFMSSPNTSFIMIQVSMNAGEMGYLCTEPIELKPWVLNEITLNKNTPIHVEFNENSKELGKRYTICDDGFHEMAMSVLEEYGASIVYHQREQTVAEYDKDGNQLYGGRYDLSQGYYISAPGAVYIIVRVAMNAGEMGYLCTEPIELKPWVLNEITLNKDTPIHVELSHSK